MKKLIFSQLILFLFVSFAWSGSVTKDNLVGKWEFTHWMEEGDENSKRSINMIMEFKDNGEVISSKGGSSAKANYKVNDASTIIYFDQRGQQIWEVVSFEPNKTLKVNHKGAVMFFERR